MHYLLAGPGCDDDRCTEKGTFAFDRARTNLLLTNAATGDTRSLPLKVTKATQPVAEGLVPKDLVTSSSSGAPLVGPSQGLVLPTAEGATLTGQPVQLTTKSATCLVSQLQTGLVGAGDPSGTCGYYEAKDCDPGRVLEYIRTHDGDDTFNTVIGCSECAVALTTAGAVAAWTVEAPPLMVGAGELFVLVKTSSDCQQCLKLSQESGLSEVLGCTVEPCKYSDDARQKECQLMCQTAYAFVSRGSTNCQCTNDATEACCRLSCTGDTKISDQCRCEPRKP
jgi:hypothetical protein